MANYDMDKLVLAGFVGEHVDDTFTMEGVKIDNTLSVTGRAADAKKTGDEITALKEELTIITGNTPITFYEKKSINTSGTVDVNALVDSTLLDCATVQCSRGDVFVLTGKGGSDAYLLYTFIDSSGTKITSARINEVAKGIELTAPVNASYLVVNSYRDVSHWLIKNALVSEKVDVNSELLSTVKEKVIVHPNNGNHPNALNTQYVWILDTPIPANVLTTFKIYGVTGGVGATTIFFLRKNTNGTYTKIDSVEFNQLVIGENAVKIPNDVKRSKYYIGIYSNSSGLAFSGSDVTNTYTRIDYSDIEQDEIQVVGSGTNLNFNMDLYYERILTSESKNAVVTVDPSGNGDYTTVIEAMTEEPENTVIFIKPGIYEQDMSACLTKRVILIGADRNQCIIRDTDGRYGHHALYISCGYFENLTIEEPYIAGTSQTIGMGLGAYAIHIDADGDYAIGKQAEFHHCSIKSDFFPALGVGLRKDMTLILDDCWLENNQIEGRGDYSDEGSLGALYFHDSNGAQGDQYVILKNNVFRSKLKYALCPYQVDRESQNNRVHCDFINNVLYSEVGHYADTVWFRGDPFNPTTGIFSIGVGYGNSIASLNN